MQLTSLAMISNFRCVLNVVFFLLGDPPASEFYVPTHLISTPTNAHT